MVLRNRRKEELVSLDNYWINKIINNLCERMCLATSNSNHLPSDQNCTIFVWPLGGNHGELYDFDDCRNPAKSVVVKENSTISVHRLKKYKNNQLIYFSILHYFCNPFISNIDCAYWLTFLLLTTYLHSGLEYALSVRAHTQKPAIVVKICHNHKDWLSQSKNSRSCRNDLSSLLKWLTLLYTAKLVKKPSPPKAATMIARPPWSYQMLTLFAMSLTDNAQLIMDVPTSKASNGFCFVGSKSKNCSFEHRLL